MLDKALNLLDELRPAPQVDAHCDGPCGVYDPSSARIAAEAGNQADADSWYDQAATVWSKAVRLYPGGYLDIENWLKTTGRSKVDVYL